MKYVKHCKFRSTSDLTFWSVQRGREKKECVRESEKERGRETERGGIDRERKRDGREKEREQSGNGMT